MSDSRMTPMATPPLFPMAFDSEVEPEPKPNGLREFRRRQEGDPNLPYREIVTRLSGDGDPNKSVRVYKDTGEVVR